MTVNINKRFALRRIVCLAATLALLAGAVSIHTTFAATATSQATAPAATVTVPANVKPVKSYKAEVGKSYNLPKAVKQTGDTYASSATATMTVDAATGAFKPVKNGVAYIVATNAGQKRYIKITIGTEIAQVSKPTNAKDGALNGYNVVVNDATTLAVTAAGNKWPIDKFYFYDSASNVLGYITGPDMTKIQYAYMVKSEDGWGAPSHNGDWQMWFASEFNKYRGISGDVTGGAPNASGSSSATNDVKLIYSTSNNTSFDPVAEAAEVIRLVNEEREKIGLSELTVEDDLTQLADARAKEIAVNFSHSSPYNDIYNFGENIHFGSSVASGAMNAWMNSKGHKAAILSDSYEAIGVGVYRDPSSYRVYWVQVFRFVDQSLEW